MDIIDILLAKRMTS